MNKNELYELKCGNVRKMGEAGAEGGGGRETETSIQRHNPGKTFWSKRAIPTTRHIVHTKPPENDI